MARYFILFLFFSLKLIGDELKINITYDHKPYKLYSVFTYKDKVDQSIGFLGFRLGRIFKNDKEALWELRKYQVSKTFGSIAMITGLFTIFFEDFKYTRTGSVGLNVLIGSTIMAVGYGVGFRYAIFCLLNAVDIFNSNLDRKNQQGSFFIKPTWNQGEAGFLMGFQF